MLTSRLTFLDFLNCLPYCKNLTYTIITYESAKLTILYIQSFFRFSKIFTLQSYLPQILLLTVAYLVQTD